MAKVSVILSLVMVRKKCLDECGMFDSSFTYAEGFDLWLKIARQYPVGLIKKPLVQRVFHDSNITLNRLVDLNKLTKVYLKRLDKNYAESFQEKPIYRKALSDVYWGIGYEYYRQRKLNEACASIRKSLCYSKSLARFLRYIGLNFFALGSL